jgi:hypothetical protein
MGEKLIALERSNQRLFGEGSIADSQQVFPLTKVTLEAHAFGNLKG